jgi:hypothetical protein
VFKVVASMTVKEIKPFNKVLTLATPQWSPNSFDLTGLVANWWFHAKLEIYENIKKHEIHENIQGLHGIWTRFL